MSLLALLALLSLPCLAEDPVEKALDAALADARLSRTDLAVRADRYDTRMKLDLVERLLEDPAGAKTVLKTETAGLRESAGSAGLARFASALLGVSSASAGTGSLEDALAAAQPLLDKAASSLSAGARNRTLAVAFPLLAGEDARPSPADFDAMSRFDLDSLLAAARLLTGAVDRVLPSLPAERGSGPARERSSDGRTLVSRVEDEVFSEADLSGVSLLIHFGKRSRYLAPPAAAGEGEARVVIDFAPEVVVEASTRPSSGAGVFGIGLLYLPNPDGVKTLKAGDVSLGAGLFGVGGLFAEGPLDVQGGRFTQGAGAFGLGVLSSKGTGSRFALRLAGQGFGFTRGAGLFLHRGDGARLDGGRIEPDPREGLAALSMSQGVGLGPRAYAAGGVGIAVVDGDRCELDASYLAQGQGYWHSLGLLAMHGSQNRLQARRYVQGAGVHSAFGALLLSGDENRLASWGAGPALGWDYGAGLLALEGEGNRLSSEWASGRGDVNGHGLLLVHGKGNRLALAEAGSGALKRGAPSWGIAAVSGEENRVSFTTGTSGALALSGDPWGLLRGERLEAGPLPPETPAWPAVDHQTAFLDERARLLALLAAADKRPAAERLPAWLHAAASGAFDPETALAAADRLLRLPQEERSGLVRALSFDSFDELVWMGLLLPAYGRELIRPLLRELPSASPMRRVVLLGSLRHMPYAEAVGPLLDALNASDWRERRAAVLALESLLDRRWGQEPGRLRLLETALSLCGAEPPQGWSARLGEQRLGALYAALSLGGLKSDERSALLRAAPRPFEPVERRAFEEFARVLRERPAPHREALRAELEETRSQEGEAVAALRKRLDDPDAEVVQAALCALSAAGGEEDAARIEGFLEHPQALLRETAAAALGRMGGPAGKALRRALGSVSARTRALAAVGVSQTSEPSLVPLLRRALRDRDENVRRAALSGLLVMQAPLRPERIGFAKELRRLASDDPSPSVRAAAVRALSAL